MSKSVSRPMLLVLRHAHRDLSKGRELDNGLSPKGRKQAAKILKRFKKLIRRMELLTPELRGGSKGAFTGSIRLISSPAKRCQETLSPLAAWLESQRMSVGIEIDSQLAEGPRAALRARTFKAAWTRDPESALTVVCSHGDWIPGLLHGIELSKGGWAELELVSSGRLRARVFRLLQRP